MLPLNLDIDNNSPYMNEIRFQNVMARWLLLTRLATSKSMSRMCELESAKHKILTEKCQVVENYLPNTLGIQIVVMHFGGPYGLL